MNWRKPAIFLSLYLSGSKIPCNLQVIKKLSGASKNEIKNFQDKKLEKILLHAYMNVPYYHRILPQSGVISKSGKINLKNFSKINVLTKDIIRKEGRNLYSNDYKKRRPYFNTSGGSTGEPVKLIQDRHYSDWNIANKIFIKSVYGQEVGAREMRLWGSERDIIEGRESIKNIFRNWLYNRKDFNSFRFNKEKLLSCLEDWNRFKPGWVESYVQSAEEFCKFVRDNNYILHSPKGILVSAGKLYPETALNIKNVTNTKIIDRYGSREVGDIAFSCQGDYTKLHVCMWNNLVESLQDAKKGVGMACVTNLNNYSMPLIRYKIGDIIELGNNNCKKIKTQIINQVRGREVSILKNAKGESIDGEYFTHLFYNRNWIKKFKIIQNKLNEIQIFFVLSEGAKLKIDDRQEINNLIKLVMGKECKVSWMEKNYISNSKSGKHIFVENKIK